MHRPSLATLLLAATLAAPTLGNAQDSLPPWQGGRTASLGQPPRNRWYAGGSFGLDWRPPDEVDPLVQVTVGGFRSLSNPVTGLLGAAVEGYLGVRAEQIDAGARALLVVPVLRLSGGIDYNIAENRIYPLVAYTMPVRRGGVFGSGSLLRVEWEPGSGKQLLLTALVPVGNPAAGHTRPRHSEVSVPVRKTAGTPDPPTSPELIEALGEIRAAATRMLDLVVPHLDIPGGDPEKALAPLIAGLRMQPALPGRPDDGTLGVDQVVRFYHSELVRAFSIAASDPAGPSEGSTPEGQALCARARAVMLQHVLYPFDRLLGQWKSPGTLLGLGVYARGNFARELVASGNLAPDRTEAVLYVFQEWLSILDMVRARELAVWGDDRVLWLPLQLGLMPEEHDTQEELDRIVEQVVGQDFTDGNRVWYVVNEQFQTEVTESILDAREYHVLWIHDFRGRNSQGKPDALSLRYVVDAYLRALTQRVRQYDARHVLPVYMIFLDEHYYEVNRGRIWLDFLEHPLGRLPKLPKGFESFEATLQQAQGELAAAVAGSRLLQAEAQQYGSSWLRNLIKVHVNVTNPADPSFWGPGIMPVIGIPDNIMRDHRKIAFYDISEEDPYRGLAIYTGMGIGEHYAGPTWEDRAIIAQGPAVLTLKGQARRLLLSQGISEERIPYPLRPREKAFDYSARVAVEVELERAEGLRDQRAMELHNETGYLEKRINVAKAALYNLMPPGSVVKSPDSLWGSALYAALLTGSACRGVRVLIIAPSLQSAPSSGWPAMAVAHDLMARLIVLQQQLGPEIEAAGGMLKTGIYNPGVGTQDVTGRFTAAYLNGRRTPFLRRLFPLDPSVDSLLVHLSDILGEVGAATPAEPVVAIPVEPKMHLKANFLASREGWDRLVARPELALALEAYIRQLHRPGAPSAREEARYLNDASQHLVDAFRASLPPEARERVVYYLMLGSANQDYRSMFMDGEASVLLSGWSGVVGLIDFGLLANLSVWVDDLKLLDELIPPPSGMKRSLARHFRPAL